MKDSFPGYYPLSNDQMKAFLSDAIIVFDVNALLDLFRIEENQAKTVLEVLKMVRYQNAYGFLMMWRGYIISR